MRSRIGFLKRYICNALHDLVSIVQFKKREKYPWRLKVNCSMGAFQIFKIAQMIPNCATHLI